MMNAKRQIAVLLVMACAAWIQASAAQKPSKKAPATASKSAPAPAQSKSAAPAGKRDPFVSLAVVRAQQIGATCGTGKRCLVIDQVELKGVVKTPSGMIAMVENPAKKAYFLRESDPVFNGYVVKITGNSVIFKETSVDNQGRTQTRDVVKRISAPAV
jgi:Tfp pilus assembly protein PilP